MSEQDRNDEQNEVEAHKHRHANDEREGWGSQENIEGGSDDDDFELHAFTSQRPSTQ